MKIRILFSLLLISQLLTAQVQRKVLIEDFTGAWCGWCPLAMSYIDQTQSAYGSSIIEMTLHGPTSGSPYYEPMACTFSTNLINSFGVSTYPSTMIDRADWSSWTGDTVHRQLLGNYTGHNYLKDITASRLNVSSPVE